LPTGRRGDGRDDRKVAKLAGSRRSRIVVETQLAKYWSAEEISAWLARAYPDDAEMRVSHETISMSLFVQGRGALRQELHTCLRSGRALRQPKARTKSGFGQGQIVDKVMICERPAEVADRAVPGHWEGDLISGRRMTCVGTLVERSTRYVMLFPLPNVHTAEVVRVALAKEDPSVAHRAAPLADMGSGTRDGSTHPVHDPHRRAGLLL
jgi:IS30 family transposase